MQISNMYVLKNDCRHQTKRWDRLAIHKHPTIVYKKMSRVKLMQVAIFISIHTKTMCIWKIKFWQMKAKTY